jgi:hypothetical protein
MNLRQLNIDLAVVDSALAELEERRTAIVHQISRFSLYRDSPPGILQFPNVPIVETYAGGCHVWSSEPNSMLPKVTAMPRTGKRKPTSVKLRKGLPNRDSSADRN